jgi:sugar lactone lactonase YvrE
MKNPYLRIFLLSTLLISIVLLNPGCKKAAPAAAPASTVPVLTTPGVVLNVTSTTAQSGGIITSNGNAPITANGICYSTTDKTPTLADSKTVDSVSTAGTATTNFTSKLTGLTGGTLYYVRAYATNSVGTAYGNVVQFTTSANLSAVVSAVTTFAGNGTAGYVNATGISAQFNNPQGITVDKQGNIYVSDSFNNYIREITPAGVVTTFAGNGTAGYADGPAASAEFYAPRGLAIDAQGNLYVCDYGNSVIRKITPAGVVSTFAGNGAAGIMDGAATVAEFRGPSGIAFDGQGNLYVADRGNNMIRKVTSAGVVSSVAGLPTAGYVDATGSIALFNSPNGVAVDATGNIYVADQGNSAIRKIAAGAVVTTLVGGTTQSTLLNLPAGITIDATGNIYIVDEGGRILEYTTTNSLYNLAGSLNISGFVNGTGTSALFSNPQGITIDTNGNIYVADQNNSSIRKITVTLVP